VHVYEVFAKRHEKNVITQYISCSASRPEKEVKGDDASVVVGVELDVHVWVRYVFTAVKIRKKPKIGKIQ
jgi:hypothetical protein